MNERMDGRFEEFMDRCMERWIIDFWTAGWMRELIAETMEMNV